ncbi:uncharacterized protein ACIBXB_008205 [Morphnus guianensis]
MGIACDLQLVSIHSVAGPLRKLFDSFLPGCCLCVGLQSRPTHPGGRSRVTGSVPAAGPTVAAVVTSLLERLQDNEGDRVQTYRQLESALQGGDGRLQSGVLNRLIAEASGDIRAAQVSLFSLKTEVPQCPCESSFSWGALPGEERPYPVPRWGAYRASEPLCARRLMSHVWRMELGHTGSQFQLLASLCLGRGSGDSFLWGIW